MNNILRNISIGTLTMGMLSCDQRSNQDQRQESNHNTGKPNILWIVADDMGPDLGCYGDSLVRTPNIDKLASQGIVFNKCFTVSAVSSPSRSALITGMYPVSIDCHQHRTRNEAKKMLPDSIKTLTEYFEEAGYFTFNGKFSDHGKPGKQDYNFITDYKIYDGTDWSQRKDNQPFFGQIQIQFPHRPFVHDTIHPIDQKQIILPPYIIDHWVARQDWALYLETIQFVDRQAGTILDRLEKEGLADNTYIFFFGDQGRPIFRHKQFLYDGGTQTPLIIRYPDLDHAGTTRTDLISNIDLAPTALRLAGIKIPEHLQGKDFLNDDQQRKEVFTMRDRRDETVDRIRAIRTNKYKYIRNYYPERPYLQYNAYKQNQYPVISLMEVMKDQGKLTPEQEIFMADQRPGEELYDLENDPHELYNLAGSEKYREILFCLRSKLDDWIEETDLANYPENHEEVEFWTRRMANRDSVWKARKGFPVDVSSKDQLDWWENEFSKLGENIDR